ncbi:MAG: hypothetical protein M3534_16265, partial [Actinomycetota bacterium]|nr:hypothetical protein [Actinomycetota bacterium]
VLGAVAGSAGLLLAALTVRPLRDFLSLTVPGPLGWTLVGAGVIVAVLLGRTRPIANFVDPVPASVLASPA